MLAAGEFVDADGAPVPADAPFVPRSVVWAHRDLPDEAALPDDIERAAPRRAPRRRRQAAPHGDDAAREPRRAERAGPHAGAHRAAPARTRPPARPADGGRAHAHDGAALARRLPAGLRRGARPQDLPRGRTGAPRPRAAARAPHPPRQGARHPPGPRGAGGATQRRDARRAASTRRATSASIGSRPAPAAPTSCAASCRASASRSSATRSIRVDRAVADDDFSESLQLLAAVLEFDDPVDGRPRRFESRRRLDAWPGAWPRPVTPRDAGDVHRRRRNDAVLRRAGVTGPV